MKQYVIPVVFCLALTCFLIYNHLSINSRLSDALVEIDKLNKNITEARSELARSKSMIETLQSSTNYFKSSIDTINNSVVLLQKKRDLGLHKWENDKRKMEEQLNSVSHTIATLPAIKIE